LVGNSRLYAATGYIPTSIPNRLVIKGFILPKLSKLDLTTDAEYAGKGNKKASIR